MNSERTPVQHMLEEWLAKRIGLDPAAVSHSVLDRAVRERMRARGLRDEEEYAALLTSSEEEAVELTEALVVPETWFFRDLEPFLFLRKYLTVHWRPSNPGRMLRVMSVPCSSGEEPYSIVITLLEAGLTPEEFRLTAIDVSHRALEAARRGLYGPSSFRENDEVWRHRYFRETPAGLTVSEEVAACVDLRTGNVLEREDLEVDAPYDLVFFRNLLIYLDPASRRRAVANVNAVLKQDGLLFLGYAEPQTTFFPDYQPVRHPRSYACRKGPREAREPTKAVEHQSIRKRVATLRRSFPGRSVTPEHRPKHLPVSANRLRSIPHAPQAPVSSVPAGVPTPPTPADLLDRARQHADQGRLAEAEEICRRLLEQGEDNADAHYLLALVALAGNREEQALHELERTVYLNPRCVEALVHLGLLMEKRGRAEEAVRYRERIRRIEGA